MRNPYLSKFIRHKRKTLLMTQKEFSEKLNMTQPYVVALEKGNRGINDKNLKKIIVALDIKKSELVNLYYLFINELYKEIKEDENS